MVKELDHNGRKVEVMRRVLDEKFVMARLEPSVMLIDELTNTGHSTQAAALQLMAEVLRAAGSLPPPIHRSKQQRSRAHAPMVNRLCVLKWEIDREAIRDGWRNG